MDKKNMKPQITVEGITFDLNEATEFEGRPAGVYTTAITVDYNDFVKDNFTEQAEEHGNFTSISIIEKKEECGETYVTLDLWYLVDDLRIFKKDVKELLNDIDSLVY
jgi:hypothetical protein